MKIKVDLVEREWSFVVEEFNEKANRPIGKELSIEIEAWRRMRVELFQIA